LHLSTSVLSFLLFYCFFSSFFGFMVEESSGGVCVLGSVRRTFLGFCLFVLYVVVVLDPVEIGGKWIPIRGSCS
jgi:hypothetical protein